MEIPKNYLKSKQNAKKSLIDLCFELLEKEGVELDKKEKETFKKIIKKCKEIKNDDYIYNIFNTLLKDRNEKTTNIKGRIISELQKNCGEKREVYINKNIYTNIQMRHAPFFSPKTKLSKGYLDESLGKVIIRKYKIKNENKLLVQYYEDTNYFDEKVLYVLCTLSRKTGSRTVFFTLKEMCRLLNISEEGRNIKKIRDSISRLMGVMYAVQGIFSSESRNYDFESFRFLSKINLVKEEDKDKYKKSYVVIDEELFRFLNDGYFLKKMKINYLELNGYEYNIYSYLDVLRRKKDIISVGLEKFFIGIGIDNETIETPKKNKKISQQVKEACKRLKEKKYIKDFKIEGSGRDKKYTFYFID